MARTQGVMGGCARSAGTRDPTYPSRADITPAFEQSIPELDQESAKRVHAASLAHMRAARLTDAELIYTPSQIAVACVYLADAQMAETYLSSKGSGNVLTTVQEIAEMIQRDGKGADVGLVKDIDRRLKLCKNPERVPGTKLYVWGWGTKRGD